MYILLFYSVTLYCSASIEFLISRSSVLPHLCVHIIVIDRSARSLLPQPMLALVTTPFLHELLDLSAVSLLLTVCFVSFISRVSAGTRSNPEIFVSSAIAGSSHTCISMWTRSLRAAAKTVFFG